MVNPLMQSIDSAVIANHKTAEFFNSLGNKDAPDGFVTSAYRQAKRAMISALQEDNPAVGAKQVFSELRQTIKTQIPVVFLDAYDYGVNEAWQQLTYYRAAGGDVNRDAGYSAELRNGALGVVLSELDAQEKAIMTMILAGMESARIVGDDDHVGALGPGDVLAAAVIWITSLLWDAFGHTVNITLPEMSYKKQAIAVLDRKTTDCCLRVHGQIAPFNGMFKLTGYPSFADQLEWSPFHWYCRTSIVLYSPQYDTGITKRLRDSANYVLAMRARGEIFDQHPADAFVKTP